LRFIKTDKMFQRFYEVELLAHVQASKLVQYCSVHSYVDEEVIKSHHSNVLKEITRRVNKIVHG